MLALIKLELRKNRLLFAGMMGVSCLICISGIGGTRDAALTIWWLLALVIGGSCGAQFRAAMKTEEDFPQTPAKRTWSAFIAGMLIVVCMILAGLLCVKLRWHCYPGNLGFNDTLLVFLIHLAFYAPAFLFGYASGDGVTGGALAFLQIALGYAGFAILAIMSGDRSTPLIICIATTAVLFILMLLNLGRLADAISRGTVTKIKLRWLSCAMALLPLAPLSLALAHAWYKTTDAIDPLRPLGEFADSGGADKSALLPEGVPVLYGKHTIYMLHHDGSRTLLLKNIKDNNYARYSQYVWTPQGELWLLLRDAPSPQYLFYHGTGNGLLQYYASSDDNGNFNSLHKTSGGLKAVKSIYISASKSEWRSANFPPSGKDIWQPYKWSHTSVGYIEIPGAPKTARTSGWTQYGALAGGGFAQSVWKFTADKKNIENSTTYSMTGDGEVNRPVKLQGENDIVRVEKGAFFTIISNSSELRKIDTATGNTVFTVKMKEDSTWPDWYHAQPVKDGIFAFANGNVIFYDWNGKARQL